MDGLAVQHIEVHVETVVDKLADDELGVPVDDGTAQSAGAIGDRNVAIEETTPHLDRNVEDVLRNPDRVGLRCRRVDEDVEPSIAHRSNSFPGAEMNDDVA